MPSNQKIMAKIQAAIIKSSSGNSSQANETNKENRGDTGEQAQPYRGKSESPAVSPKTIPSEPKNVSNQNSNQSPAKKRKRKSGGIFGNGTFDPKVAAWSAMVPEKHPRRKRGGTVLSEPETDERMMELARGGNVEGTK